MAKGLGKRRHYLFKRPRRRGRMAVSLVLVFAAGVALAVALTQVSHAAGEAGARLEARATV